MMQQYMETKSRLPIGTLLLFRLGDFYELFEEDAVEGARILGITLTARNGCPMAGIPYHAWEGYINKLLKAGKKVAICEQMTEPEPGKLVERALTRILTPGTILEESRMEAQRNAYLLALDVTKAGLQAAWADLSTGQFWVATDENGGLLSVIFALQPKEILLPESHRGWKNVGGVEWAPFEERLRELCPISELPDYYFDSASGTRSLLELLGVLNLQGFGLSEKHPALGTAGAVIQYATDNLCQRPQNLSGIREYFPKKALSLDTSTLKNLEIFQSAQGAREGSLLEAMDRTVTPNGARLLETFLATPLLELSEIERRQRCVGEMIDEPGLSSQLQGFLKNIRDIPRILSRLQNRIRNPRELGGIRDTLQVLPSIYKILQQFRQENVAAYTTRVSTFDALKAELQAALNDELPGVLQEGGIIRRGYSAELDRMRDLSQNSKQWLTDLEQSEQARTGIRNLKIRYNGAFGYFIEVTKSQLHLVPAEYIRKQTMTNAERYATEALKIKEKEILEAEGTILGLEETLFRALVERCLQESALLRSTADALAELDVLAGWASLARDWNYCCPKLDDSYSLEIESGRHPVVEQRIRASRLGMAGAHAFVPNDTHLDCSQTQIALITGPNMAGKSTYIRQVALITFMAQVGCWVPAKSCRIGTVDRIFSRVGASDELARGNSTFMVEMNETANILNNATPRSLIILDEIGRGTSTYDGLSIAWAVIEHLHGNQESGPRTLFATHYHELTQLEKNLSRLKNYSVAVKEWNEAIVFVRQVVEGAADRSYGIHVARLAGLPTSVVTRAKTILSELESEGALLQNALKRTLQSRLNQRPSDLEKQLELFCV
ncbi:MAG: DNA mismatch repair protein MutS [Verrucomicrobia bacterium GWF2_51_19]|nr:MAG: DNA mismatch repair protein MutS [Verrucomicrobia bacterium GWF2_51_19]